MKFGKTQADGAAPATTRVVGVGGRALHTCRTPNAAPRAQRVELRAMLQRAERIRRDHVEGRFIVEARYRRRAWHIIVEPDHERMCILVITAYPVST